MSTSTSIDVDVELVERGPSIRADTITRTGSSNPVNTDHHRTSCLQAEVVGLSQIMQHQVVWGFSLP